MNYMAEMGKWDHCLPFNLSEKNGGGAGGGEERDFKTIKRICMNGALINWNVWMEMVRLDCR